VAEDRQDESAQERTDLAQDRTILANERTFAGWLRTGLGCVAVGLGFQALFDRMSPDWVPKAIATAFLAMGILVFVLAQQNARAVHRRIKPHEVKAVGTFTLEVMTWVLSAGAAALIAALWLARIE